MKKTTARASRAPQVSAADDGPLVDVAWIRNWLGRIGENRVRQAMTAPGAPKPILGGGFGSRALWSRTAVVNYFETVVASGVWPEKEAA